MPFAAKFQFGKFTLTRKNAINNTNVGQPFCDRTTFEAFQSASDSFFYNRFDRVTFLGSAGSTKYHTITSFSNHLFLFDHNIYSGKHNTKIKKINYDKSL